MTCSTTRLRIGAGSKSETAAWIEAGAAKDQPAAASRFTTSAMWSASCLQMRRSFSVSSAVRSGDRVGVTTVAVADGKASGLVSQFIIVASVRIGDFKSLDKLQTRAAGRSLFNSVSL